MGERPSVSELLGERYGDVPIHKLHEPLPHWATHVVEFIDETVKGETPHRNIPFGCKRDAEIVAEALRSGGHREASVHAVSTDSDGFRDMADERSLQRDVEVSEGYAPTFGARR